MEEWRLAVHRCRGCLRLLAVAAVLLNGMSLHGQEAFQEESIRLREVSAAWGVDFRHHHGGSGKRYMVETVVGGVVLFDFDLDGDVDIFLVDAAPLPGYEGEEPRSRLFRNDGPGRFVDWTDVAQLSLATYGCGGTAGDVDNDGDFDLYVTAFGANELLRNEGDGSFTRATAEARVGDPLWSMSAAFSDTDRDGDLDLYVTNYVDFTLDTHKFCGDRRRTLQGYCHPSAYEGLPDRYYRNRGDGTFVDATVEAGFGGATHAGLGVAFGDVDGDGWPDLYVANDADPNFLFHNRGDGSFADVSLPSGTAYDEIGTAEGSMGVEFGDVDRDGDLDLVVTNFEFETNALYKNSGSRIFIDSRFPSRIAEPSLQDLAFGVVLVDLDHDADLDLVIANGHILDNAAEFDPNARYAQVNRVFENLGAGRFRALRDHGLSAVRVSRGLAHADLDGDGDQDLVIVNSNDRAEVLENLAPAEKGGWLKVDLRGAQTNHFGVGARVEVELGSGGQLQEVQTGSSYLSQSSLTAHFGLAGADRVGGLTVRWPSGEAQRILGLPVNRSLLIFE